MFNIHKMKGIFKKAFTPFTIMVIPHNRREPLNVKVPFIGILSSIVVCFFGIIYLFTIAVDTFEYYRMREKLNYYSEQFAELSNTIVSLKIAEKEFQRLFSLGSKEEILENIDASDSGSVDLENLKQQIKISTKTIDDINIYLHLQRDIYVATPMGLPANGEISSWYGRRQHPRTGKADFHSGIDISIKRGSPIRATADGIVSFSGWNGGSGNLIVLEHGHGFTTVYAHNKMNTVKVGQKVKRDEVIGYVGSTGYSTGPHVHYEIWKKGKHVNPRKYTEEGA